jgi:translocation and assembly module TamB
MGIPIEHFAAFKFERAPLSGMLSIEATGSGSFDNPTWQVQGRVPDLYAADEGVGAVRGRLTLANNVLTITEVIAEHDRLHADCQGNIALNPEHDATLQCDFAQTSLDPYLKFVGRELPFTQAIVTGSIGVAGPLSDTTQLSVDVRVTDASLRLSGYLLSNDGQIQVTFRDNVFRLDRVRFTGEATSLEIGGAADVTTRVANLHATGQANLAVLQAFYPALTAEGPTELGATLTGTFDDLVLAGRAVIKDGRLRHFDWPHGLSRINGPIVMEAGRISVDGLTGVLGEGAVAFSGGIALDGYRPVEFNLDAIGKGMHLRFPRGLQSTVEANLHLRGPIKAPVLSGDVNVQKASYSLRFDPQVGYFNLLGGLGGDTPAAPAEPSPFAFPLALAIKIRAPLMPFVDNKAAGALISGRGEVDITGTIDRPIITGRVDADRGEWLFSGYRYRLLGGYIDFTNPFRFDPFFEVDAETRIRTPGQTYVVNIRVTGTLDKFTPTVSSDPWLPELQIVSLLLGETPDVGAAELRARSAPQELQTKALSTAAFAIITSPITATVGSAVQRVTRIDSFQIVPLLGAESAFQQLNPTARIILGKRISDRVYLTYSRTLSSAQNEIILVEFDQNDQVSWVLSRNEDRTFALDFRLRYVFR